MTSTCTFEAAPPYSLKDRLSLVRHSSGEVDKFVKELPSVVASKTLERDELFMELFCLEWRARTFIHRRDGWATDMRTVVDELREGGSVVSQTWRTKLSAVILVHAELCRLESDLSKAIAHIASQIKLCEEVVVWLSDRERAGDLTADVPTAEELRTVADSYRATLVCARRLAERLPSPHPKSLVPLCLVDVLDI
ncbi:hypothetical protein CYLTODRAFT_419192 [Cylindrobasidium torrendii FP15055 ss-10]|uniref:Uncharacterized protein n=1 Tax=Cylindrobasidium torrendii FP15055 ss-10 TaxID=1314674 RepID=A0A0D7BLN4_9AGAR|nr:hypothetical protein CYLTODRAFT_419192 [Cylindrobasidium torrendii FP15055 ss-10]